MDSGTAVLKFLESRKWYHKGKADPNAGPTSHNDYLGACWYCPASSNRELLREMAKDIYHQRPVAASERATEFYRAFLDIDLLETDKPTPEFYARIGLVAHRTMKYFMPSGGDISVIVSSYEPMATINSDHIRVYKYGMHVVFPFVIVCHDAMEVFDAMFVIELDKELGKRAPPCRDAEAMVDPAVHKREDTKLRMNGSVKAERCPCQANITSQANRKKLQYCGGCNKGQRVLTGSVYRAVAVVNHEGHVDDNKLQVYRMDASVELLDTSIRTTDTEMTPEFSIPRGAPAPLSTKQHQRAKDRSIKKGGSFNPESGFRSSSEKSSEELNVQSPAVRELELFIRTRTEAVWSQLSINKVIKDERYRTKKMTYKIFVYGIGQHSCLNVTPNHMGQHNHTKSSIFFELSSEGICQRCLCKNNKQGRGSGRRTELPCRQFRASCVQLPTALNDILFPRAIELPRYRGDNLAKLTKRSLTTAEAVQQRKRASISCADSRGKVGMNARYLQELVAFNESQASRWS